MKCRISEATWTRQTVRRGSTQPMALLRKDKKNLIWQNDALLSLFLSQGAVIRSCIYAKFTLAFSFISTAFAAVDSTRNEQSFPLFLAALVIDCAHSALKISHYTFRFHICFFIRNKQPENLCDVTKGAATSQILSVCDNISPLSSSIKSSW